MAHPETPIPLAYSLTPAGPVTNIAAAERLHETLIQAADADGWRETLDAAWPALAPVAGASPYLAGLMRRRPAHLRSLLEADPVEALERIIRDTDALDAEPDAVRAPLWDLEQVTDALSRFADASCRAALRAVAAEQRARGRLISPPGDPRGPIPGLFGLAMGKHGANELNYSSDIDISLFFQPRLMGLALREGEEMQDFANRVGKGIATLLTERTGDGYVFRVDLRLRPDPSSTPPVVAGPMALAYYESVGQNWERAAFIKARPVLGDMRAAGRFLKAMIPFIWRRSLDYAAVLDIQSIKKQIHVHKTGEGLQAAGANLKLGRGGIREIEFYAQTQQLILGGRDPALRKQRTLEALKALAEARHVPQAVCEELSAAYVELRGLEHRVQMLDDEQTHRLPEDAERRAAVAALAGSNDLAAFDARVEALLARVNARYGELCVAWAFPRRPLSPTQSAAGITAAFLRRARRGAANCSPAWRRACWRPWPGPVRRTRRSGVSRSSSPAWRRACRSRPCS